MTPVRVVECSEIGPIEKLRVVERPDPIPGRGMAVVDVEAAGVNYVDALFVQGRYQIKPPVPFVPGSEVAGTISAVGEGVDDGLIGQRIVAMCGLGGFAEKVAVLAFGAVPIPDVLDSTRAAGFIQSWCTARFALEQRAHLQSGETVLVLGAGGGVGQATVAVAAARGARVVAVASTPAKRRAALLARVSSLFVSASRIRVKAPTTATNGTGSGTPNSASPSSCAAAMSFGGTCFHGRSDPKPMPSA